MSDATLDRLKTEQFGVFFDDFLYCSIPDKRPVIENFLYGQDVLMFQGEPGEGKSTFMNQLIFNATTGTPFLGFLRINKPLSVLLIQSEGNRQEQNERMKALEHYVGLDRGNFVHINTSTLCFDSEEDCKELARQINAPIKLGRRTHYDLVVIDPLYATVYGDPSKAEVAALWQRNFRRYMQGHPSLADAGFIIVSHPKKASIDSNGKVHHASARDAFGARNWANFFSSTYAMRKVGKGHTTKRKIEAGKRRDSDKLVDTFQTDFDEESCTYGIEVTGKAGEIMDYFKTVGGFVPQYKLIKYFRGEHNMPESTVKYHLNKLLNEKVVQSLKVNGKIGYKVTLQEEGVNGN